MCRHSKGAMDALVLKWRESDAVGSEQKCKLLQGRWMEKTDDENTSNNTGVENLNMGLRSGVEKT